MTHDSTGIVRLVGVYDADGGLRGELAYVVGHLLGRVECALCDITHSPVRRKRSWDALVASLPVPMVTVHRNELPPEIVGVVSADRLPAVYAVRTDGSAVEFVGREELRGLDASVEAFDALVRERLTAAVQ
ncbi:hypothetical protein GA707_05315 [Nostocoides sp. F2B08]|uniref:hypothetical protein n=1 Tax=Nostocoides sp. F2B08 TaxID=2653936 RepID=UPI0012631563|nr:hypothetical protein [Tetrasphaera sp. F2B08]KAB7745354.1 hypothetical protein GA707_05315 [Tetrasphaera sp. F2B08]